MADQCEHDLGKVSDVTRQLIERDRAGLAKYGTTLDRTDLALTDWLQHLAEELLDAAGYALAAKREALAGGRSAPARKEAGLLDDLRDLQKFIEWNRSSGEMYVKPGFESVVLDHVRRYAATPAAQAVDLDGLRELADAVVITNATGNERLFLGAVQKLLARVRALIDQQAGKGVDRA